ncbi:MAG: hypothetical protein PVJ01_00005 [Pseudomonadota bacterium]|jgi:hypothetical protein
MARGRSGRIVLEIDPMLKNDLYEALGEDGLTLKEWFIQNTSSYLDHKAQPSLFQQAQSGAVKSESGKRVKK